MNVARIKNGIVVNIEVMEEDYFNSIVKNEEDILVIIPEKLMIVIGNSWSEEEGFVGATNQESIELTKPEGINEILDPITLQPINN